MSNPSGAGRRAAQPHDPPPPAQRSLLRTLGIISAAYIALGANIQGFRALFPAVLEDFAISRGEAGLYTSFFFLSATGAAILAGRITDRVGAKSALLLGASSVGVFMMLHAFSPWYGALLALAFAAGAGFSVITPAVNLGVMEAVAGGRRAFAMGLAHSGGAVGGFLGAILLPVAGAAVGWRGAVVIAGGFALLMGLVIRLFYHGGGRQAETDRSEQPGFLTALRRLMADRQFRYTGMFGLCLGMTMSAISTHFALFLHQDMGLTETWAGLGLGALLLGGMVGPPGWGWASDVLLRGNRRRALTLLGLAAGSMCLAFGVLVASVPWPLLFALAVLLGLVGFSGPGLYFTSVSEMAPPGGTGTTTGLALMFVRVGVVVSPPLFGALADRTGTYRASWIALAALMLACAALYRVLSGRAEGGRAEPAAHT